MRMLIEFKLPIEPFNTLIRNGTVGKMIQQVVADIGPEAVYFTERNGQRGGIMVVDVPEPSAVPRIAEPLFLAFEASVEFRVAMTPEDLAKAGLDELGKRYGRT